jgi:hypothetical protein
MSSADSEFENWWNDLELQQRLHLFRLLPVRSPEQVAVFSARSWHELQGWMRRDLRRLYGLPGLFNNFEIVTYFRAQSRVGRGQAISGITYFVISDTDRQSLPELADSYGIAIEELPTTSHKAQFWLFASEAAFDEDILQALSSLGESIATNLRNQ